MPATGVEQHDIEGKKVLVVGGTGNIGRALCWVLSANNDVDVLARFSSPAVEQELAPRCRALWKRDLSHDSPLEGVPKDYDYVFNMAVHWALRKDLGWDDFFYIQRVNTLASARLLYHCKDAGAAFVFGSTGGVYHPCRKPGERRTEQDIAVGGDNPYEISKIELEGMVLGLSEMYDAPVAVTRFFWPIFPWGGGGPARGTIQNVLDGKPIPRARTERGKRPMNLGFVSDLAYATIRAAALAQPARLADEPTRCIYNISGEEAACLEDIAREFAEQMGVNVRFEDADAEGPHEPYVADVTKMSRELWTPRVGWRESISAVVRGIREHVHGPEGWMFSRA